jgi:hypothetical protein
MFMKIIVKTISLMIELINEFELKLENYIQ